MLQHIAAYWKRSNEEACAEKLSQMVANNIDNGGEEGVGLRIYARYCRSRHGHKYGKYKKCLSMMVLICKALHIKKACILLDGCYHYLVLCIQSVVVQSQNYL